MDSDKKPFHVTVAEKLIEQLKQGTAPWQKPWDATEAGAHMPVNPINGARYTGINAMLLMGEGREDQRWMTYQQAESVGARVRKGEIGTSIQYWKFSEERNKTDAAGKTILDSKGEPVRETIELERPSMFVATVFNAEQIVGLPPQQPGQAHKHNATERAEKILLASGATIHHGKHDLAFYRSSSDIIFLPEKDRFPTADKYYATALHALCHWTGHGTRLDRDLNHPSGSEGDAREALRAEIASMILGDELGLGHAADRRGAYVASWIKVLKDDPLEIFRAAADAEKIQRYVMSLEQRQVQKLSLDAQGAPAHTIPLQATERPAQAGDAPNDPAISHEPEHDLADEAYVAASAEMEIVWIGNWSPGDDGSYETRALVAASSNGFHPAFEVSRNGGDSEPMYYDPVPTFEQARKSANSLRYEASSANAAEDLKLIRQPDGSAAVRNKGTFFPEPESELPRKAEEMEVVWMGNWTSRDDGSYETRILVAASSKGFHPGVELSRNGGDSEPIYYDPVPTFEEAEKSATRFQYSDQIPAEKVETPAAQQRGQAESSATSSRLSDAAHQHQSEAPSRAGAAEVAEGLVAIESRSTLDEHEKVRATASLGAERIHRNPDGNGNALAAARVASKDPEFSTPTSDAAQQSTPDEFGAGRPTKATHPADAQHEAPIHYLAVPYRERSAAKAAGAKWDKTAKSWYAGHTADMAKLDQWKAENTSARQIPAMSPREEFAEVLKSAGCVMRGEHPIMDGRKHRILVESEKLSQGEGSGLYVGRLAGHPDGYVKNNMTGVELTWRSKGYALDAKQKSLMKAYAVAKLQQRQTDLSTQLDQAALRVVKEMETLVPVEQPTPYMQAKCIAPQSGAFTDKASKTITYLPVFDVDGKQWSTQYVYPDGTRCFAKDSRTDGCFHVVGGKDALSKAPALVICEGYATAAQLKQTLGYATVAAFDSENLAEVAQALRRKFPHKPVVIAGDDDRHLEFSLGINPSRAKAEEAAKLVGGKALLPTFAPGENSYPAGLDPVTPAKYREHRKTGSTLNNGQLAALDRMKQFTDFNDLATKSALGPEGVSRQALSLVDDLIKKHSLARIERQPQAGITRPAVTAKRIGAPSFLKSLPPASTTIDSHDRTHTATQQVRPTTTSKLSR